MVQRLLAVLLVITPCVFAKQAPSGKLPSSITIGAAATFSSQDVQFARSALVRRHGVSFSEVKGSGASPSAPVEPQAQSNLATPTNPPSDADLAAAAAAAATADYSLGLVGVDGCLAGFVEIATAAECAAGSSALNLRYNSSVAPGSTTSESDPRSVCFLCEGSADVCADPQSVNVSTGHGTMAQWLCKKATIVSNSGSSSSTNGGTNSGTNGGTNSGTNGANQNPVIGNGNSCPAPVVTNGSCTEGDLIAHLGTCTASCSSVVTSASGAQHTEVQIPTVKTLSCANGQLTPATFACREANKCQAPTIASAKTIACVEGSQIDSDNICTPDCTGDLKAFVPDTNGDGAIHCYDGTLTPAAFQCLPAADVAALQAQGKMDALAARVAEVEAKQIADAAAAAAAGSR